MSLAAVIKGLRIVKAIARSKPVQAWRRRAVEKTAAELRRRYANEDISVAAGRGHTRRVPVDADLVAEKSCGCVQRLTPDGTGACGRNPITNNLLCDKSGTKLKRTIKEMDITRGEK